MTKKEERYCGYILNIMDIGEEIAVQQLHERLFNYHPNQHRRYQRTFFHKDMPSRSQLASILRRSKQFENAGMRDKVVVWRRVE
jgi:hypothetical protein